MKIAFLNDEIFKYASGDPTVFGGAERQQWLLARALARSGWLVTAGIREVLEPGERRVIDGVEFLGIGRDHILLGWFRFLRKERPDWLYWRCASHWLGPLVRVARWANVRSIFAAAYDTDVHPREALVRRRRWWPIYAWGLAQVDRVFLQHAGQLAELPLHLRSKAYLIPSIAGIRPAAQPHKERQNYVAWVATLRQDKRPELLIEIASRARDTYFVVCGGMSNFKSSEHYAASIVEAFRRLPNVTYLGQVDAEKAQKVIAEAAVFLSTSDIEGFPNTFLQAWACGTPVVSFQIDPGHVIERHGLGVVAGTIDVAITHIKRLMASSDLRDEIARRAQGYIAQHHSENMIVNAFDNALGDRPGQVRGPVMAETQMCQNDRHEPHLEE